MTKRIKFFTIILSLLLIVGLVGSIGATAAIWTSEGAGGGDDNKGTSVQIVEWNAWAKYFAYQDLSDDEGIIITKFKNDESGNEMGFNDSVLIIPSTIDSKTVVGIAGGAFADTVLKEMIEEIRIPNTVNIVYANAFSGFVNLRKIVFADAGANGSACEVEMFAFAGCSGFVPSKDNVIIGTRTVNFATNAFFPSANPSLS